VSKLRPIIHPTPSEFMSFWHALHRLNPFLFLSFIYGQDTSTAELMNALTLDMAIAR